MCEFCEPPYKDLVYLKMLEIKTFVDNTGKLWIRHYDKNRNVTIADFSFVKYCPMCGRKLKETK